MTIIIRLSVIRGSLPCFPCLIQSAQVLHLLTSTEKLPLLILLQTIKYVLQILLSHVKLKLILLNLKENTLLVKLLEIQIIEAKVREYKIKRKMLTTFMLVKNLQSWILTIRVMMLLLFSTILHKIKTTQTLLILLGIGKSLGKINDVLMLI